MTDKALLIVDIDGTVRWGRDELGRFVNDPTDVRIFPEAKQALARWREQGGRVLGLSNQGGIAMGYMTPSQVQETMDVTNVMCDGMIDEIVWCPHHPDAPDPSMRRCWCRKPSPGLLVEAVPMMQQEFCEYYPQERLFMVGDREEDRRCAELAGVDFMWAKDWRKAAST